MTIVGASTHYRGHLIHSVGCGKFVYSDTLEPVRDNPLRPCGHCGLASTPEGHDGCLGTLPGVANACCGHGKPTEAYVQFAGERLAGAEAVAIQEKLRVRQEIRKSKKLPPIEAAS